MSRASCEVNLRLGKGTAETEFLFIMQSLRAVTSPEETCYRLSDTDKYVFLKCPSETRANSVRHSSCNTETFLEINLNWRPFYTHSQGSVPYEFLVSYVRITLDGLFPFRGILQHILPQSNSLEMLSSSDCTQPWLHGPVLLGQKLLLRGFYFQVQERTTYSLSSTDSLPKLYYGHVPRDSQLRTACATVVPRGYCL